MGDKGKFVAFEGGEGSGKDTHIARLRDKYQGRDDVVFTREPGGTRLGEEVRALLLDPNFPEMDVKAELLLFLATRAQLMSTVIVPALQAGRHVISNRFELSTLAYQIYGRKRPEYLPFLRGVSAFVVGAYKPDLFLLLDIPPEVGIARVHSRGDGVNRFDAEKLGFHNRVRAGYLQYAKENSTTCCVIRAEQPLENVWKAVEFAIDRLIPT